MKTIVTITFIFTLLTGCYWGKTLNTNQTIRIIDNFTAQIDNSNSSVYINNYNVGEYKKACIDALISNLGSYNATVVENDNPQVNFSIIIEKLYLKETTKSETVNDNSSHYNGQTYNLIVCNVDVEFKLYQGSSKQGKFIGKYYINTEKEEKLTNNRDLGDYMFGSNKDNSEYRQKLLSDDIFISLCKKAGNRACGKTTSKISKKIK